jgi:hypothetical protein
MPNVRSKQGALHAASTVTPKFIARSDPRAQWTGAHKGHAFFAYGNNYLIDTDQGVVDVEAPRAPKQSRFLSANVDAPTRFSSSAELVHYAA